ncbi:MAG: DNA polymerase IV [Mariprofundus sp.]
MRATRPVAKVMLPKPRKIIHVDMDAFFASVEQRDHPAYRGKPLIVGGQPDSRGVVAACSYEARKFGIHSAMPCSQAYRRCPDAIFVSPRFEVYREVSDKIREIFWRYASQVEPLSLDEAYLNVTYTASFDGSATRIAQAIKQEILAETQLIASAGVSYNKFLAKIASDMDKPDGLYVIKPEQGAAFVAELAVGKFYGVGPATEKKMHKLGIQTGKDLRALTQEEQVDIFGKAGDYYYQVCRGIDHRPVRSSRARKSLGKEITFAEDIMHVDVLLEHLDTLAEKIFRQLLAHQLSAKTLTLKVKYATFKQVTRSSTQIDIITSLETIKKIIPRLLRLTDAGKQPVRLVGLTASGFVQEQDDEKTIPDAKTRQLKLPLKC